MYNINVHVSESLQTGTGACQLPSSLQQVQGSPSGFDARAQVSSIPYVHPRVVVVVVVVAGVKYT